MDLGTGHKKAAVGFGFDRVIKRRPKARPAGPAIKLGIRSEKRLAATGTVVDALTILFVERARTGAFGAVLSQNPILRGRQFTPPLVVA
jgi:hypothetical protein